MIEQNNTFIGNAASSPEQVQDKQVWNLRVIQNIYAGKNDRDEAQYRDVAINFVAFGKTGERLAKIIMTGDQVIINFVIENNDYEKDGKKIYGYRFRILDFKPGAPGKEKRASTPQ
ncbi:single-stranded DNA-binding protein [Klebsiella oxytoca]|uniref:single-stranded DNA-binding protein n=1 Tax=Klebsiella oxytoca TaxID=571 RepID=UPI002549D6EE|nr:single-stranded DNA-binding protein [Klebsiella oxytoca]MEC5509923.1 single-stranded DNA-binding protein [Klebsiella oxytoca]